VLVAVPTAEERPRADLRELIRLGLVAVGVGMTLGSALGAMYGGLRVAVDYWTGGELEAQ
jgi:hypothetical protein